MTADEENYEAIKKNTALGGGNVSALIKPIFEDNACINLNKQNIFQQSLNDADNVYRKCQKYLKGLGLAEDIISEKAVCLFLSAGLVVMHGTNISDGSAKSSNVLSIVDDLEIQSTLSGLYVALRAYERFVSECGNAPGECYVENDVKNLKTVASKMLSDWGVHASISDDLIHEICRFGGSDIHSISAFVGGCVAQVIKIVTKQYKPIDNSFLCNAITSETATLKL